MNSSKTAQLLMVAHNYISQNKKVCLVKPMVDTRFSNDCIVSRAVQKKKVDLLLDKSCDSLKFLSGKKYKAILVDEAQFLSKENVNALREITEEYPVVCYGLRTDYMGNFFEGSRRLMEISDSIEEIKTVCVDCDKKATINAKFYIENQRKIIIKTGESSIDLGAEEKYQPMCWRCWSKVKSL
jgi:thymidine kinase